MSWTLWKLQGNKLKQLYFYFFIRKLWNTPRKVSQSPLTSVNCLSQSKCGYNKLPLTTAKKENQQIFTAETLEPDKVWQNSNSLITTVTVVDAYPALKWHKQNWCFTSNFSNGNKLFFLARMLSSSHKVRQRRGGGAELRVDKLQFIIQTHLQRTLLNLYSTYYTLLNIRRWRLWCLHFSPVIYPVCCTSMIDNNPAVTTAQPPPRLLHGSSSPSTIHRLQLNLVP